jgi:hypothetical protein
MRGLVGTALYGPFRIGSSYIGQGWRNHMVDYDQGVIDVPSGYTYLAHYKPNYNLIPNTEWIVHMRTGINSSDTVIRT